MSDVDPRRAYRGVWVFLEQRRGTLRDVSIQLIGEGRRIADKLRVPLSGVLPGLSIEPLARIAFEHGVDRVHVVDHPLLEHYASRPYAKVLAALIRKHKPEIVLFGATKNGRDLGGRLHAILETGLAADCVAFEIDEDRNLDMIRPSFGGKSLAHILCKKHRPQMASVRRNVFLPPPRQPDRTGEIVREFVELTEKDVDAKLVKFEEFTGEGSMRPEEAKVVVSGGFGLGGPGPFAMLQELASLFGGAVTASRKAVDSGWAPKNVQVGQTGMTVRPKVYVAIGISGAVQHLAGMQESEKIVAINRDSKASIFEVADYAVVGDLFEIVPELLRILREARESGESLEAAVPAT